jgi:hypothetical protein
MNNLFEISSEERNRIMNLHEGATKRQYLNLEQVSTKQSLTSTEFPIQSVGDKFGFGQIDSPTVKNDIIALKPQIDKFIKDNGGKTFIVNITSGESNVTNPKGYETKGSLALARANSVKKYFQEIFPDLIKNGVLTIQVPTDVSQVTLGKTSYDKTKGDNKNPEKIKLYKQEQFVNFDIKGTGEVKDKDSKDICDWDGMKIEAGQGDASLNYVLTNEKLYGNGVVTFDTGTIPDRLVVLNKGEEVIQDTGYVTTRPHKYVDFKWVPLYVYQLTLINSRNNVSVSGDKLVKITANNYQELLEQLLVDPSKSKTFKRGGVEVEYALKDLQKLCNKGVKEFVLYTIGESPIKINFNSSSGESIVRVYSPIGTDTIKTGYSVTALCNKTI